MFNDVQLAASVLTAVMGSMHLACMGGTLYLRDAPVFASRVPKVVLGSMLMKMMGFFFGAWLFLDPECPCGVVPFMFIVDWTGSCWLMLKRVILLFRYEIQAALEHSKAQTGGVILDESNFFVRYRQLLRPKTQTYCMFAILGYLALGNMIVLALFNERAAAPCTFESFQENKLTFGCILFAWITAFPMMAISVWAARRLKKFPNDNWKMGTENSIASMFTVVASVGCAVTLIVIPEFDGILWVLFSGSIFVTALQFLLPLSLHRRTLSQLAKFHITTLTSLDRLLLSTEFVDAFRLFLKKEFSSENLDFWVEVNKLQERYGYLFPSGEETRSHLEDDPERGRLLAEAARECKILGSQCVGSAAPWQLNISGYSMDAMQAAVRELNDAMGTQGVGLAVEELLKTFSMVQQEVYETLRLDPYPRFLLTSALGTLNKDENFKRMLAAEKLEDDVQKSLGTSKKRHTTMDGGSSEKHSADSKKSSKKTTENETKTRPSHANGSASAPAEGSQAALRSSDISSAENSRIAT